MKGILLAGGMGKRFYPVTQVFSKHLLLVYDKPMIYYPLSTLMLAGMRDILVISTPRDVPMYRRLLGDGSAFGLELSYAEQPTAGGIAEAFIVGADFIGHDSVVLVLGDNIFYGQGLSGLFRKAVAENMGATVFGYTVGDSQRYGVAVFDDQERLISIEEKPSIPKSNVAITGLYIYDNDVLDVARGLKPSTRGELEITDVNTEYLRRGKLKLVKFGRGVAWLDTGTPDALLESAEFFAAIEHRQGLKVACIEEVAYRMGYIDVSQLVRLAESYQGEYRNYLKAVASKPAEPV
jgi:glucose-1-phosphate thymidylyltransferase